MSRLAYILGKFKLSEATLVNSSDHFCDGIYIKLFKDNSLFIHELYFAVCFQYNVFCPDSQKLMLFYLYSSVFWQHCL